MTLDNALWDDYNANSRIKYCCYPDNSTCSGKIIYAHSVQKEKILSQLEESIKGNKLIYSLENTDNVASRVVGLVPLGKSKASIFRGFCDYHDKIFSAIENFSFEGSEYQMFLFAYRAVAHGLHQLLEMQKWYAGNSPMVKLFPLDYLHAIQKNQNKRTNDFLEVKKYLDNVLLSANYASINHHFRVLKPFIGLACSSVLNPFYTYKNIFLNPGPVGTFIVLNIIPNNTETIILISHLGMDVMGEVFFEEFKTLTDDEFREAVSSLLVYCTTNTFLSPKLWDKFSDVQKQNLYDDLNFAIFEGDKIGKFYVSKTNFFSINNQ